MSFLTSVQVKHVAKFLTASCAKIPQKSGSTTHSEWLEAISHASGFRDWNAMRARVSNEPVLDEETSHWPNAHWTFLGVARVFIAGHAPINHLTWSANREKSKTQVAKDLAQKIKLAVAGRQFDGFSFEYTQPDTILSDGSIAPRWKNNAHGCPIIITSNNPSISIHLWWLSEHYQLEENYPEWMRGNSPYHYISIDSRIDTPLQSLHEEESIDSLTDIFLTQLTGRQQRRRECLFLPEWTATNQKILRIAEGCPNATATDVISGKSLTELREAVAAYNTKLGLSSNDINAIAERYQQAESERNEHDYTEFSGIYDD
jgi:hypothetical protein